MPAPTYALSDSTGGYALADTGMPVAVGLVAAAVTLLGAGLALVLTTRRRRTS